jgi:hypothetical protein
MMTRRQASAGVLASTAFAAASTIAVAQELQHLDLPPPRSDGGKPLTEALKLRRSTREYSDQPIPVQVLSDLLWAAFGINRPSGDRTAPYWRHVMVIDIYLAMADGVWLFEPKTHALLLHAKSDIRAETGLQDFVASAPLNLIYVRMVSACWISPPRNAVSMLRSIAGSSARTSICSAPRRGLPPSFEDLSIIRNLLGPCSLPTSNS